MQRAETPSRNSDAGGGPLVHRQGVDRSGRTCVSNTDLLSGDANAQASAPGDGESQAGGAASTPKRRPGGLSGMVIADLRALATELGIGDTTGMRKGDLIAAIRERQGKTKKPRGGETQSAEATLPLDTESKPARSNARTAQKSTDEQAGAEQKVQTGSDGDSTATADGTAQAEGSANGAAKGDKAAKADKAETRGGAKQKPEGDAESGQSGEGGGRRRRRGGAGRGTDNGNAGNAGNGGSGGNNAGGQD